MYHRKSTTSERFNIQMQQHEAHHSKFIYKCNRPLQHGGCNNYPMQPKANVGLHGIQASINLISITLCFVRVGREVVNNAKGYHGLQVPSANLLCPHMWKLPPYIIRTKVQCGGLYPSCDGGQHDYHRGQN